MANYRFYWLKPDGRIDTASNFEFADDQAALAHAEAIRDGAVIEVWQESRKLTSETLPARATG
jgi:hypothetical protein